MSAATMSTSTGWTRQAFGQLFLTEARMFLREPFAVIFTLLFPVVLVLLFGALFGGYESPVPGFQVSDLQVPATIGMITAYLGLMGIPIAIAEYRDMGVLRRFRASPLPTGVFLAAHLSVMGLMLVAGSLLSVLATWLAFGLRRGGTIGSLVVIGAVGAFCIFSIGFALSGLVRSARVAQAMGTSLFFLLLFGSGATVPRDQFPAWLHTATNVLPLTWLIDALTDAWTGNVMTQENLWRVGGLAALGLTAVVVARKSFRFV